jgi:hypothetical protein
VSFTTGITDGHYFTQWRLDDLRRLGESIERYVGCELEMELSYDRINDFHHLKFRHNGHDVDVQYYRVFGDTIDGTRHWVGCDVRHTDGYARHIAKMVKEPVAEPAI